MPNKDQTVKKSRYSNNQDCSLTLLAKEAVKNTDEKTDNDPWTLEKANNAYGVQQWGEKYYSFNDQGHVTVEPTGRGSDAPRIDLYNLVEDCIKRGHQPPLLIRFADIVNDKIRTLTSSFERAINEHKFECNYQQVFPLKVCPSRSVVDEIINSDLVGLNASSKPELLIILTSLRSRQKLIVCTGQRDSEYVEAALLAQQLGRIPILVIEKLYELDLIIAASNKLGIKPIIGIRTKILSVQLANAAETMASGDRMRHLGFSVDVGEKSKFGLTTTELMVVVQRLRDLNMLDCLQMLYFHIGSQISNITSIRSAVKEASQYYVQLALLGANMRYFNVGGGLGIDYDGSHTNSHMSLNYSVNEYASEVVSTLKDACMRTGITTPPTIITESGRYVTAHHSVVVFNVTDAQTVHPLKPNSNDGRFSTSCDIIAPTSHDHELCHKLYDILHNIQSSSLQEAIHDARQYKDEALTLFTLGIISLEERARIETLYWCCIHDVVEQLKSVKYIPEELEELRGLLSYTFYANFSLFQSVPDSWSRNFIFPVLPIHRLEEKPEVVATLADLTCDSDGKVSCFTSCELRNGTTKDLLELHQLQPHEPYYIGIFLTGAYQEILGSMHNLYGDTHILVVESDNESNLGYTIKHAIPGETIDNVLRSFGHDPSHMLDNVRVQSETAVKSQQMTLSQYRTLVTHYDRALRNYTYLSSESSGGGSDSDFFHGSSDPSYKELLLLDRHTSSTNSEHPGDGTYRQSDMSRYIFSFDQQDKPSGAGNKRSGPGAQ